MKFRGNQLSLHIHNMSIWQELTPHTRSQELHTHTDKCAYTHTLYSLTYCLAPNLNLERPIVFAAF